MIQEKFERGSNREGYKNSAYVDTFLKAAAGFVAGQRGVTLISSEFFLLALSRDKQIQKVFESQGITKVAVKTALEPHYRDSKVKRGEFVRVHNPYERLSTRTRGMLACAYERSQEFDRDVNGTDILYALCKDGEKKEEAGEASKILKGLGFNWDLYEAREQLVDLVVFQSGRVADGLA
jgi:hypothetical protein